MKEIILSLCVILFLSSCKDAHKSSDNFDYGIIENGVYSNKFFNFELPVNDNWSVQTKEQIAEINKAGRDAMAGTNEKLKKNLTASQINVADLLAVFEFPTGTVPGTNPSLIMNAENLKNFPNVKSSEDYITSVNKLLSQTSVTLKYLKEPYKKTIGGKEFMAMEIYYEDYNITQEYIATLSNGFAISIVVAYENEDQKQELHKMIDNLKFK